MRTFNTPVGRVSVTHETFNGQPVITIVNNEDETTSSLMLDNYQAYQLALELLAHTEVDDTRGSK